MRYIIVVILLVTVTIISCNRFDNTFEPVSADTPFNRFVEDFLSQLRTALTASDIDSLMTYFSDDYLNDSGMTKSDAASFFSYVSDADSISVKQNSINHQELSFAYRLSTYKLINGNGFLETVIDTLITEIAAVKDNESTDFVIIGNRSSEDVYADRKVLVELFTSIFCPRCPYVESALSSLKQQLGDKFYYIEYHREDQFDFGNDQIAAYYQVNSYPVGIIEGKTRIEGGSEAESFAEYEYAVTQKLGKEALSMLQDFSYSQEDDTLEFEITLTLRSSATSLSTNDTTQNPKPAKQLLSNPIFENLLLKYALIEKESATNNFYGNPIRNIVVKQGYIDIQEDMFTDAEDSDDLLFRVSLPVELPDFSFRYPALTLWLQTVDIPVAGENNRIHNVTEHSIVLSR